MGLQGYPAEMDPYLVHILQNSSSINPPLGGVLESPATAALLARIKNIQLSPKYQKLPILGEENPPDDSNQLNASRRSRSINPIKTQKYSQNQEANLEPSNESGNAGMPSSINT